MVIKIVPFGGLLSVTRHQIFFGMRLFVRGAGIFARMPLEWVRKNQKGIGGMLIGI